MDTTPLPPDPAALTPSPLTTTTPPAQSPPWWLILATILAGPACIALTLLEPARAPSLPYRVGQVLGILLLPLVIGGLFAIGRRFRNARSQLTIALIIWALSIVGSLGRLPQATARHHAKAGDTRVFEDLERKADRTRAQLAQTEDPAERLRLQKELRESTEGSVHQRSAESQPGIQVTMELVRPFMDASTASSRMATEFLNSPEADVATGTTTAAFETRIARVDEIVAAIQRTRSIASSIPTEAKRLMAAHPGAKEYIRGALDSFGRKSRNIEGLHAAQLELFEALRATMVLMRDHWGEWEVDEQGIVIWSTDELLNRFQILQERITEAEEKQELHGTRLLEAAAP